MKFTNKYNLPTVFERFEQAHQHTRGGAKYSVTTLIDSPKISRLRAQHAQDLTEDISDRTWAILGTAVHEILQSGAEDSQIVEQRMHAEIEGISVSGQIDLQTPHNGGMILSDYKTTSAFAIQANPNGKPEWSKQLSCYQALAHLNNVLVTGIEVIAIIRDWSPSGKKRSSDYPEAPIIRVTLPMMEAQEACNYLRDRIIAHESHNTEDCTDPEMWAKPTVFAVHEQTKKGSLSKRAKRLFSSRTEAEIYSIELSGSKVIERPKVYSRCDGDYCNVSKHCDQFYNRKSL